MPQASRSPEPAASGLTLELNDSDLIIARHQSCVRVKLVSGQRKHTVFMSRSLFSEIISCLNLNFESRRLKQSNNQRQVTDEWVYKNVFQIYCHIYTYIHTTTTEHTYATYNACTGVLISVRQSTIHLCHCHFQFRHDAAV
jgi:hypothetical protein